MTKRIFRSIMLVSALVLVIGLGFIMGILYHYFGSQIEKELKSETAYLAISVENMGITALDDLPAESARITLIAEDGSVLFDNKADASKMENHSNRQEVIAAKLKGVGKATTPVRYAFGKTIYYAKQLSNGQILRVSSTQYTVAALIGELVQPMLYVLLMMVVLSALFAARISKKIVSPINSLDLDQPERTEPTTRYHHCSQRSTNNSALSAGSSQMPEDSSRSSIITENMSEGLLVIDAQTDLLSYNSSALHLLDATEAQAHASVLSLNRSESSSRPWMQVLSETHHLRSADR